MNGKIRILAFACMLIVVIALPIVAYARPGRYNRHRRYYSPSNVTVTINGQRIRFNDQQPVIIDNRVLVPVRGVFEYMGFNVRWYYNTRVARLYNDHSVVIIPADINAFVVNNRIITPDVPQRMINNRLMLPLRAVAEALGGTAEWDSYRRIAHITNVMPSPSPSPSPSPTPTPSPSPNPTDTPTPSPSPYPPEDTYSGGYEDPYYNQQPEATPTPNPLHVPFLYTRSAIQLPNARLTYYQRNEWLAEYHYNGGPSHFEMQMIRLVNETREYYGLNPLTIEPRLMQAARFYTQTLANLDLNLSSTVGPYGGSRRTAEAFGARINWSGGSGNSGGWSYTAIFNNWMRNQYHRNFILSASSRYIGFGSHLGGSREIFHYLLLSSLSSE